MSHEGNTKYMEAKMEWNEWFEQLILGKETIQHEASDNN